MFLLVGEEGNRESHNNPTEFFLLRYTPAAAYIYLKNWISSFKLWACRSRLLIKNHKHPWDQGGAGIRAFRQSASTSNQLNLARVYEQIPQVGKH